MHLIHIVSNLHQLGWKIQVAVQRQIHSKAMEWHIPKTPGSARHAVGQSISGLNPAREQCRVMLMLAPDGLRVISDVHSYSIVFSKNVAFVASLSKYHF